MGKQHGERALEPCFPPLLFPCFLKKPCPAAFNLSAKKQVDGGFFSKTSEKEKGVRVSFHIFLLEKAAVHLQKVCTWGEPFIIKDNLANSLILNITLELNMKNG